MNVKVTGRMYINIQFIYIYIGIDQCQPKGKSVLVGKKNVFADCLKLLYVMYKLLQPYCFSPTCRNLWEQNFQHRLFNNISLHTFVMFCFPPLKKKLQQQYPTSRCCN